LTGCVIEGIEVNDVVMPIMPTLLLLKFNPGRTLSGNILMLLGQPNKISHLNVSIVSHGISAAALAVFKASVTSSKKLKSLAVRYFNVGFNGDAFPETLLESLPSSKITSLNLKGSLIANNYKLIEAVGISKQLLELDLVYG
jgi:hypothetical protein